MKLFSLFYFVLLTQCIHIALGDSFTINDANDWKTLITQASGGSYPDEISLNEDLDLSSVKFSPLGINDKGDCIPFTGTLNGNDHTVQNVKMNMNSDTTFSNAFFLFTINFVGFCQRTNRQRANHTISEERGGDYRAMASSQGVLSEGEKREKEGGF